MKAKIYIGAKKYALYIGRKIVQKTLEFLTLPARFVSKKVQELKNLTIWGQSKQGLLPDGYTQLEYIEGTGTQYIVIPERQYVRDEELEIDFAYTSFAGTFPTVYGSYLSEIYTDREGTVLSFGSINISEPQIFILEQKQTIKAKFTETVTGIQALFGYARSGDDVAYQSIGRMYKFIDRLNDVDVYNMLPARRNSDGVLGMYDLVSGQFLTNSGTGEFIAGDIATPTPTTPIEIESVGEKQVLPYGYTQLEYIESTGTQEIDTGISVNDNLEIEITAKLDDITSLYGTSNAGWGYSAVYRETSGLLLFTKSDGKITTYRTDDYYDFSKIQQFNISNNNVTINNIELPWTGDLNRIQGNLTIFSAYESTIKRYGRYKLYSFKVKGLRDLIPARRNSDGVVGMYDLVSNTFFTNQGTGEFVAGDVVGQGGYKIPVEVGDTTTNIYLNEPLRKIGEYADTMSIDGTNVTVTRNVSEVVLNGSEDILSLAGMLWISKVLYPSREKQSGWHYRGLSNYGICGSARETNTYIELDQNQIWFGGGFNLTPDNLRTLLAQNNCICYYPIETPTTETYTIENPIQLEQGTLTIDTDTKIKPSKISITGDIDNE